MSEQRPESLRKRVLQGSAYLTLRNGVSMLLSLIGSMFITRIIGPENYGLFTAASSVWSYLQIVGSVSIVAYLVREQSEDYIKRFHLAFWWLLGAGSVAATVASGVVLVAGVFTGQRNDFALVAVSLFAWLPAALICAVPQALLERSLNYRALALVQLAAQVSTYLIAIPLAQLGFGAWALVAGFWLSQAVQLVGYFIATRYRPQKYWCFADWKQMMHYSVSQSLSVWLYNLRDLAPSLILFPFAGERAMGYYALANRLVSMLSFLYSNTGQIAFSVFARIQEDKVRFTRAIQEAIEYLVVLLGVAFGIFAAVVGWLAALMLGSAWDSSLIQQLCIVMASRVLISSVFGVQTQALYVVGQNWLKFRANLMYAVVLAAASIVLVGIAPVTLAPLMLIVADHIAHMPTYGYDFYGVRRYIGRFDYRLILLWLTAAQAALFAPLLGYWLYGLAGGLLMHPLSMCRLRTIIRAFKTDYLGRSRT